MKSQLSQGIKTEREHKDLVRFLNKYVKLHHRTPSSKTIYRKIAEAHIKENPNYYKRLKKARL